MLNGQKTTDNKLYFMGLILLGMSLPLSKYTTGLFHFFLLFTLIFDGTSSLKAESLPGKQILYNSRKLITKFIQKCRAVCQNKTALLLISIYLLFLTSIFRGGDKDYLLTDLRIKLPLLALPFIVAAMKPLSDRKLNMILWSFTAAVFIGTIFSSFRLLTYDFTDIREISWFISPVRFALQICFSIVIVFDYLTKTKLKTIYYIMLWGLILWFIFMLLKLESLTGLLILLILGFIYIFQKIYYLKNITIKFLSIIAVSIFLIFIFFFIRKEATNFYRTENIQIGELKQTTALGNPYVHDTLYSIIENGRYTGLYLCEAEMREAWNSRSHFSYDGQDQKGQALRSTLSRFLTSMDLPKDDEGVSKLSTEEIAFIEQGIANKNYVYNPGIRTRISKILLGYEIYRKTGDPNGNSLAQRLEYWKNSLLIIKNNFWMGVGTGNIPIAFKNQYEVSNSKLLEKNKMESHNQYFLILISFGIFGFAWFLYALLFPAIKTKAVYDLRYFSFLIIILLSMITEDTLETQTGVTFFAFFNSLFLLHKPRADKKMK